MKRLISKHETWSIFEGLQTEEEFTNHIFFDFNFNEAVHVDIKNHFRIVSRLLECSYFEYEFITVAEHHALFGYELAFRKKFEELNGINKKRLADIIKWFTSAGYFSEEETMQIKAIRTLRNLIAHPNQHSILPPAHKENFKLFESHINKLFSFTS